MTSLISKALGKVGVEAFYKSLTLEERRRIQYLWEAWARPSQLPPAGEWLVWLLLAGRGFGKTRSGGEFVRREVEAGRAGRVALIERTPADARDVMVEGESGLLAISPPWFKPVYEPSKRQLTWPNGAIAKIYTSWEPDMLRGPQHDLAWCEELASWKYLEETWDNLLLGLRLGPRPRAVVTTTPKPKAKLKEIMAQGSTVITRGSTYENLTNLSPLFRALVVDKYEGTRLGRQELHADLLDDMPGALWKRALLEANRVVKSPELRRIVVGVDPPGGAAECGIVAGGLGKCDCRGKPEDHVFILQDRSLRATPDVWADAVLTAYSSTKADRIVGEANFGGDMVWNTVYTAAKARGLEVAYKDVRASRGKAVRAEPVAALYEQHRVHHVGMFSGLEDELCTWVPGETTESPNRLDALVWVITELVVANKIGGAIIVGSKDSRWKGRAE